MFLRQLHDVVDKVSEQDTKEALPNQTNVSDWNKWLALFQAIANSEVFKQTYWERAPLFVDEPFDFIKNHFTLEKEIRESVQGSFIHGLAADPSVSSGQSNTWKFRAINDDPTSMMTFEAVTKKLEDSTVYWNNGGILFPKLGAICLASQEAFDFPNTINVYITKPKMQRSLIPHTDKQDVFVIQTQGAKAWKVYAPPNPRKEGVDPLARGKSGDELLPDELGEPLLDIVMEPGQLLYIPVGFPHSTCTVNKDGAELSQEHSVHLTLGIDTHVWGLTYSIIRWCALRLSSMNFKIEPSNLTDEIYERLQTALPLGFLKSDLDGIVSSTLKLMQDAEPDRFKEGFPEELLNNVKKTAVFLVDHHRNLTEMHNKMYKETPVGDVIGGAAFVQKQYAALEDLKKFSTP